MRADADLIPGCVPTYANDCVVRVSTSTPPIPYSPPLHAGLADTGLNINFLFNFGNTVIVAGFILLTVLSIYRLMKAPK